MPTHKGLKQHRVAMVLQVALEECKEVCVRGKVDVGEQIRLKNKVAATLSCGNGELMKVFQ